jgi:conjugative transfer signal peptidase TraF
MAAGLMVLGAVLSVPKYTLFTWNHSPSMPEGLYARVVWDEPAVGKIVVFPPPASVVDYARRRGSTAEVPLLVKSLAAGPGDRVCTTDGLTINGQWIAPVFDTSDDGVPLPRWRECRVLASDEWFAYAPRIPNSLDSRYYGPVREADIIGVYLPVWTD